MHKWRVVERFPVRPHTSREHIKVKNNPSKSNYNMFVLMQLCPGFDQQMALCSHWIESVCCFQGVSIRTLSSGKGWFSTKTICDNLERDIKGNPAVCSSMCLPFLGAHHPEHSELFMPALTREPRSGLQSHWSPQRPRLWMRQQRQGEDCVYTVMYA